MPVSNNLKPLEWTRGGRDGTCILITSHRPTPAGYIDIRRGPRRGLLHRLVCERRHGLLGKRFSLHSCDNPACANPDHLRPGTQADNIRDMDSRGRRVVKGLPVHRGTAHWQAKLSEDDVLAIRADERKQTVIAAQYGVDSSLISRIKTGKYWKHLLERQG